MLVMNREMNRHEKDKIRFRTIRYIERYCDIERKCQICGDKAEIHHPNYNEYLKINLLCKEHHRQLHNLELIQPKIIDLEKDATVKPPRMGHTEYVGKNIKNIKEDIFENGQTMNDMSKKYHTSPRVIRKFLSKMEIEAINRKSKENAKLRRKQNANAF